MKALSFILIAVISCSCRSDQHKKVASAITPSSADFGKAEDLLGSDTKKDSAFFYFTRVAEISKDSLLVAMAYAYMAMIQEDAGDYYGSQESTLEGIKQLNEKNPRHFYCLSSIYNEMGASNLGLKNYDAAIEYYDLAIKFQEDETYKNVFLNNKAVAYREKGEYLKAIQILQPILKKNAGSKSDYARILTNLASLKWRADSTFNPVAELNDALRIRKQENDEIGITASYIHLSDYYLSNRPDSALVFSRETYSLTQKTNNIDDRLDALKKLIYLTPNAESRIYFKEYQELSDSINNARNTAKNQFALIRFQSEKHKAENLSLQQDNSQKELKILRQRISIYSIAAFVVVISIFSIWWFRKKKQQIELESQAAIRESHLRTSQKVHDIVANGLYRIMNEIEHREEIEKEILLNKIDQLYERSRDISYEPAEVKNNSAEEVSDMLSSFATSQTRISVVGNQKKIWETITPGATKELKQVLQELMINMARHSGAQYVVVRFDLAGQTLVISYRDDGIGFTPGFKYGNGLKSTETRIKSIGGEITFTAGTTAGASIKIVIPLSNT